MKITVNGQPYDIDPGTTLAGLLERLSLAGQRVAVEHNRKVVRQENLGQQVLREGDRVEVVHFVGGG